MHCVDATMFYCPRGGGVKRYLHAKHAWLTDPARGVRHTLVVPRHEGRQEDHGAIVGCAGAALPLVDGYRFPLNRTRWVDALLALSPDLIEAGDPYLPAWATRAAAQRLGIPAVAFFHSDVARMLGQRVGSWIRPAVRSYLRALYAGFDLVLAPSRTVLAVLHEAGVGHARLQPLGVDTQVFHPQRRDAQLKTHLGLAPDARLLLYAGRFAREKNIDALLDAARRLGAPYHLLLVGARGDARRSGNVTFWPYEHDSDRLAALMAGSDAFVHAGDSETFGLVLAEAMACGTPVVAVDCGAARELVAPDCGVLAARAEGGELAAAVTALFAGDPGKVGARAHRQMLASQSWDACFRELLRSYRRLVGGLQAGGEPRYVEQPG